jgi:prepilin-type processing-associated H-X9-DG protein
MATVDATRQTDLATATADRNPRIASPAAEAANAVTNQNDGQNVLFVDGHVTFETRCHCGLKQDNTYTLSPNSSEGSAFGIHPPTTQFSPRNECDSVLVHDALVFWVRDSASSVRR